MIWKRRSKNSDLLNDASRQAQYFPIALAIYSTGQLIVMSHKSNNKRLASRATLPLVVIVFCLCAFWLTTQFDRVPPILKRGIQPSDFPQLVIGLIVLLSVVIAFTDQSKEPKKLPAVVWKTMVAMAGFVVVAQADMFLGVGTFAGALVLLWGERSIKVLVALGVFMPLIVFFLFDFVFEIRFPRGLLTNLWYG